MMTQQDISDALPEGLREGSFELTVLGLLRLAGLNNFSPKVVFKFLAETATKQITDGIPCMVLQDGEWVFASAQLAEGKAAARAPRKIEVRQTALEAKN